MADITVHKAPAHLTPLLPGLALTAGIAAVAMTLGNLPSLAGLGLGALTLAIVLGIVLGNTVSAPLNRPCEMGVLFAKQKLLRIGIILYGFRLTFQQIADVGVSGIVIDILVLSSTFLLACWLGRNVFGLDRDTVWLIGAGSSICGAAAILATEPVIKADPAKVTVAVATVVIFGTLAIFIYPLLYPWVCALFPWVTAENYGIFTGSTLHEVAQVVAAGHTIGAETENSAVIAKMLRVMMLAPFLALLGAYIKRSRRGSDSAAQATGAISFPWFALLFIVVALFNSLHLLPVALVNAINAADTVLLAMAMAALGLTTRIADLKRAGLRPLLLGLGLFIWLIVGGGSINLLINHLMA